MKHHSRLLTVVSAVKTGLHGYYDTSCSMGSVNRMWVLNNSKKNILIPNVAEKNILILVEEKNNTLIQSFCHITYC
jgi:hypothetical protein